MSFREKARDAAQQKLEELKGSGWWLNRSEDFDISYKLGNQYKETIKEICGICNVVNRKDSRLKVEIIIANLLRFRDLKRITVALKTKESTMAPLIHKLEEQGFLGLKTGYRGNSSARYSRIWPTRKLLAYFERVHTPGIIVEPPDLLELRDDEGNIREYRDTDRTRRIKAILKKANEVNRAATILYGSHPVSTALVAIFRRKLTLYGRLHTKGCYHYQGLGEEKRAKITISGDSVVELDFSGLHPHLLYAEAKIQLDKDPYSTVLDDPELRDFLKKCLLTILNATSCEVPEKLVEKGDKLLVRKSYGRSAAANAEGSINQEIGFNRSLQNRLKKHGITKAIQIVKGFKETHKPIAHHFFSDNDNGLRVMNKDASIALDIVDHFVKKGVPILAIHDSFIVQEQHKEELHETMDRVYKKHTGGFSCPIK